MGGQRGYEKYRCCVRLEFVYRCVYCLATEPEVAQGEACGGFEIEHLRPQGRHAFRKMVNKYENLYWACFACNRAKGGRWPSPEEEALGCGFIDPCAEPLGAHLAVNGTTVEAANSSRAGEYMIEEINLNSATHRRRREQRAKREARFSVLTRAISNVYARPSVAANREQLKKLQTELNALAREYSVPPWDRCDACLCPAQH